MLNKLQLHLKQIKSSLIVISFLLISAGMAYEFMHMHSKADLSIILFSGFFCLLGCTLFYYGVNRSES